MLKLYNSLSRKKQVFKPLKNKKVNFYVCGPTVYGPGHIGHARTYLAFDIIRRYLEYKGYKVKYVMNITDVHDDIIKEAKKQKTDIFSLSKKYSKIFLQDQETLGIKKADVYPKVTENIKEIIEYIKKLKKAGFAYVSQSSVYFDISKFKDYGKLSGVKPQKAKTGTRVKTDKYEKENISDFVLWKKAKKGEPSWQSPWGKGRPGWHIECSVMSKKHLGEQIDIHGGAKDLKFPHHENEIAQSEAVSKKKPFVKYWLHAGLLNIRGQKMSKSLGNFITIKEALEKWPPRVIRMLVALSHYRSELDWNEKNLWQAEESLERVEEFINKLKAPASARPGRTAAGKPSSAEATAGKQNSRLRPVGYGGQAKFKQLLKDTKDSFEKAMDDDFNTPKAMAEVFKLIKKVNPLLDQNKLSKRQAQEILKFLKQIDKIFNFIIPPAKEKIPEKIQELVKKREKLRQAKNWPEADKIRKQIEAKGYKIKDTKTGAVISKAWGS